MSSVFYNLHCFVCTANVFEVPSELLHLASFDGLNGTQELCSITESICPIWLIISSQSQGYFLKFCQDFSQLHR